MESSCTFCKIIGRELAAVLLEETPSTVVFLDRNQAARGHVLVVPREHVSLWHELDEPTATAMSQAAHRWAKILVRALRLESYNLLMNNGRAAGQDVFHAHLHITPRAAGDGYYAFGGKVRAAPAGEIHTLRTLLLKTARA